MRLVACLAPRVLDWTVVKKESGRIYLSKSSPGRKITQRASFLQEANRRDNREIVATAQTYDVVLPASFAEKLERKKLYLCAGSPNGNS